MHQLKHEIPLLIYEERRCAARGQKRIHLDRTKTFCHHFIAARRRLGSGSPFASLALPPMLSLPPSHLVCADLLPPRPPQRNASLCSRFTTDPSRVLSYLSLVPRTSSPSFPSAVLPLPQSPSAFFASEVCRSGNNRGGGTGGSATTAKRPRIYSSARRERASCSRHDRPTASLACVSVRLSVERASCLLCFFHGRGTHTELFRVARAKGMKRRIARTHRATAFVSPEESERDGWREAD